MKTRQPLWQRPGFSGICLATIATLFFLLSESRASVTIDFTAGPGEPFLVSTGGSAIPNGNAVDIGYFDMAFDVTANASDIVTLGGSFNVFGTTTVQEILTEPGRFGDFASQTDPAFDGKQIYMLAYLTTTNGAPNKPTYDNVTEYGLFTNSVLTDWIIPSQTAAIPSTLVGTSQVDTAEHGSISGPSLMLSPVPEPSTGLLLLGGFAVLLLRRRVAFDRRSVVPPLLVTLLAATVSLAVSKNAGATVTIDYTAQIGQRNVIDRNDATIPAGSGEVRVGVLASHFDLEAHAADLQRLREAWIPLGATPIREVLGEESRFSAATSFSRPELTGQKLYFWVLATNDGAPVRDDHSNVIDYGLYSSTEPNWVVPSEQAVPPENSTIINSSQVDLKFGPGDYTGSSLRLTKPAPTALDYSAWAQAVFPEGTAEADTRPEADPDQDGLSNRLEQFTGNHPLERDPKPPYAISLAENGIVFEFERSRNVPAGAATIEATTNLREWVSTEDGAEIIGTESLEGGEKEQVRILLPFNEASRARARQVFLRLNVGL